MTPFYSIISTETNHFSNEKIAVGLIFVADKVYFKYSETKLKWLKKLKQGDDFYDLTHSSLKNIEQVIKKEHNATDPKLFKNFLSKEYFAYLNQYAAGVISFSEPALLAIEMNESVFESYYEKMIGETYEQIAKASTPTFTKKIKTLFTEKNAAQFADLDYVFKVGQVDGILKDYKLPLITKNGAVQGLDTMDFTQSENTIISKFYETEVMYKGLHKLCESKQLKTDKLKIAFEIPDQQQSKKFFDLVYKEKKELFDFKEFPEVESFIEKAGQSGVYQKFSELID